MFKKIPSLDNEYEIDETGCVREVATGRILKHSPGNSGLPSIYIHKTKNKKHIRRAVYGLWAEAFFGAKVKASGVVCQITKGSVTKAFGTVIDCADFFVDTQVISRYTARLYLTQRHKKIGDWKITYYDSIPGYKEPTPTHICCEITNGSVTKTFKMLKDCSRFLADKLNRSPHTMRGYLAYRRQVIGGWTITYHEN